MFAVSSFQLLGFAGDGIKVHLKVDKIMGVLSTEDMFFNMQDLNSVTNDWLYHFSRQPRFNLGYQKWLSSQSGIEHTWTKPLSMWDHLVNTPTLSHFFPRSFLVKNAKAFLWDLVGRCRDQQCDPNSCYKTLGDPFYSSTWTWWVCDTLC